MTAEGEWGIAAVARIRKLMFVLGAAGTLAALAWRGWTWGAGFAVGALASWLNFRWLKQIADALGGGGKPRARSAVFLGLRYIILGGGAYVIVRLTSISLPALLGGLFVSTAAVIIEILFELTYARD